MSKWEEEVIKNLENLDEVPTRNPLKVQSHKQNFMKNAQMIKSNLTVSSPKPSWWRQRIQKKEFAHMKIITIFAVLGLLFGGGISAVAAQDSLPGDILYPVKTLVEDIELGLATDPERQFKLSLEELNTRFDEIQYLQENGEMPPEPFFYDMYLTVEETLKFALQSGDPIGNLNMIQETVREQSRFAGDSPEDPIMQKFQNTMKFQQNLIEAGIDEPENLVSELEYMYQYRRANENDEDVWQNLYQTQTQMQNAGTETQIQYYWMFTGGDFSMDEPPQYGQSEEQGQQNSFNDHPNGGNQGDNGNGGNGGNGSGGN